MRTTHTLLVAGAAALLASGGFALGASTSSPTIHACAKRRGGALRLASTCKHSERAVTWAVTGPRGATGPAGRQGADGANGADGTNGINGVNATTPAVRAYARVTDDNANVTHTGPDVIANHGFASITSPSSGNYCLAPNPALGINPATDAADVSAPYSGGFAGSVLAAQLEIPADNVCPSGDYTVRATVSNTPNPNVGFSIVVP
jgi:hypothetical protein